MYTSPSFSNYQYIIILILAVPPIRSPNYFKAKLREVILFPNTIHISPKQKYTLKKYNHSQASDFSSCFLGDLIICLKQDSDMFYTLHLIDVSLIFLTLFK